MKPLRILIVNKFFYPRGGDCIVAMNQEQLLRNAGFQTAIFTMDYPKNEFPKGVPVFTAGEVSFSGNPFQKLKGSARSLGAGVGSAFRKALREFKPDLVHFHNIHSYLSPEIVKIAHNEGIPTVWTMHDYKLVCPSYSCLRDGRVCEECIEDPKAVVRYKCHKGSALASSLAYAEARKWDRDKLSSFTDAFICPSDFMRRMLLKGGFPEKKLVTIHNCITEKKLAAIKSAIGEQRGDYYLYIGRLSTEKRVDLLISAAINIAKPLHIYGDGPMAETLKKQAAGHHQIVFHGFTGPEEICKALTRAKCSVIPSGWYDNNPLSVIESLCAGTPVVGTDIGGIPELIVPGTGIIIPPFNAPAIEKGISEALSTDWNNDKIFRESVNKFSPERHLDELISLYERLIFKG